LISGYPTLSQRVANLRALKDAQPQPQYARHPLAYLFAFFSFGGSTSGGANFFITIAIVALLAAIAIPNFLRAKISANESMAQSTLRSMATAAEAYAADHAGQYPVDMIELVNSSQAYLKKDHCGTTTAGYFYDCLLQVDDYQFIATPIDIGTSGFREFTMTKEGLAVSEPNESF